MTGMMCVIARLDDAATNKLAAIRNVACADGLKAKPLYGHITLATYTGEDAPFFIRSCKEMLKNTPAFDTVYEKIEILEETSIIAAIPAVSDLLASIHRRITEQFNDALDKWTKAGVWYPHTTLYYNPQADLQSIRRKMEEVFTPFEAHVNSIEFSHVCADGYRIVDKIPLLPG